MDAVLLEDDDPLDLADGRADRVQNVLQQKQTDYLYSLLKLKEKRQLLLNENCSHNTNVFKVLHII